MRRRIAAAALLVAATVISARAETNAFLSPFGVWFLCANFAGLKPDLCAGSTPGSEQYILQIQDAPNSAAVAYRYSITATLADGTAASRQGIATRNAQRDSVTTVAVSFGGVARAWTITVDELIVAGTMRRDTR